MALSLKSRNSIADLCDYNAAVCVDWIWCVSWGCSHQRALLFKTNNNLQPIRPPVHERPLFYFMMCLMWNLTLPDTCFVDCNSYILYNIWPEVQPSSWVEGRPKVIQVCSFDIFRNGGKMNQDSREVNWGEHRMILKISCWRKVNGSVGVQAQVDTFDMGALSLSFAWGRN